MLRGEGSGAGKTGEVGGRSIGGSVVWVGGGAVSWFARWVGLRRGEDREMAKRHDAGARKDLGQRQNFGRVECAAVVFDAARTPSGMMDKLGASHLVLGSAQWMEARVAEGTPAEICNYCIVYTLGA